MARLFQCGFELNSLTNGVEFIATATPSGSIQTSIVHGGTYAYRNNPSASAQSVNMEVASGTLKTAFVRFYYYVTTQPASNALVFYIADSSGSVILMRLRGTGAGLRAQNSAGTQVGSDFAVSTGTWHYIDVKLFSDASAGTIDVLLDGVSVVSGTGANTGGSNIAVVGFGSSSSLTHDYYIDDVAVNSTSADNYGTNTSYCGVGSIIAIRPDSTGDSAQWTRGGADSGANWSQCNEVTPNDATNYVQSVTAGQIDMYNCGASGLSGNTIKAVSISVRLTNDTADAVTSLKVQVEKASGGTVQKSSAIIMSTTTWRTNGANTTFNPYPIVSDADPDLLPWTPATLDTMQIGVDLFAAGTHNLRVSTVWAMVEYAPSAGNTLKTVNGLAATSIKTIQTLARASVKTYDGLTPP